MLARMPSLDRIRRRLEGHEPSLVSEADGLFEAAVAIILHAPRGRDPEILFIERAIREGDPWSGQMAFPGGRRDAGDQGLDETAARETLEEVGVALRPPIARLDDFEGSRAARPPRLVVAPYVFEVDERPEITINYEVQSTVWVPVPHLIDPASGVHYRFDVPEYSGTFPAIRFESYTIWGLTYRILEDFFALFDEKLARPE